MDLYQPTPKQKSSQRGGKKRGKEVLRCSAAAFAQGEEKRGRGGGVFEQRHLGEKGTPRGGRRKKKQDHGPVVLRLTGRGGKREKKKKKGGCAFDWPISLQKREK